MTLDNIHSIRDRAHLYGAEWVVAQKEAAELANYPSIAAALKACAAQSRSRYFRELEAIDTLLGNSPSPFANLG